MLKIKFLIIICLINTFHNVLFCTEQKITSIVTLTYDQQCNDAHRLIFNHLIQDGAIDDAKNVGLTCKKLHSFFFEYSKDFIYTFLIKNSNLDNYDNETNNQLYINLLEKISPLPFIYTIKKISSELKLINTCLSNIYINNTRYKSIEKIDKETLIQEQRMQSSQIAIEKCKEEITNEDVRNFIIELCQKEQDDCKAKLKTTQLAQKQIRACELAQKTLETIPLFLAYNKFNKRINNKNKKQSFDCFGEIISEFLYAFAAANIIYPWLNTNTYYTIFANLKEKVENGAPLERITADFFQTFIASNIQGLLDYEEASLLKKHVQETIIHHVTDMNKWETSTYKLCGYQYTNHNKKIFLFTLPRFIKSHCYNKKTYINCNWLNALTGTKENSKKYVNLVSSFDEEYFLSVVQSCDFLFDLNALYKRINCFKKENNVCVTFTTNDEGVDRFTLHNKYFLYNIVNNQYSDCIKSIHFKVPKDKKEQVDRLLKYKPWYNWYNTLYYLDKQIHEGPPVVQYYVQHYFDNNDLPHLLFIFLPLIIAIIKLPNFIIKKNYYEICRVLAMVSNMIGGINFIKPEDPFERYHPLYSIPWHIIYVILRDNLLIYNLFCNRSINYLLAGYALIELFAVQESLFYLPLFKNLYKQYILKNNVTITTY